HLHRRFQHDANSEGVMFRWISIPILVTMRQPVGTERAAVIGGTLIVFSVPKKLRLTSLVGSDYNWFQPSLLALVTEKLITTTDIVFYACVCMFTLRLYIR
ncbi:hypothetical protein ACJX0J_013053, partial [Zea mays]